MKTKHTSFQIAACRALCQFSASSLELEQKERVTRGVVSALRVSIKAELCQALCHTIVALQHWMLPGQKELLISCLIEKIPETSEVSHQYRFVETLFTLRDWLEDDALLEAELNSLLHKLDYASQKAYGILDKLILIGNERERAIVIRHLMENLESCNLPFAHNWLIRHISDLTANDKITVLARLERVGTCGDLNQANDARRYFTVIHALYSQDIVERLVCEEVEKYHFPVEITQYLLSYT